MILGCFSQVYLKNPPGTVSFKNCISVFSFFISVISVKTEYYPKNSTGLKVIDGYTLTLWKFDCEHKKTGLIQWNVYSKEDNLLTSLKQNQYLAEMAYAIPDSVGEGFFGVFCNNEYK